MSDASRAPAIVVSDLVAELAERLRGSGVTEPRTEARDIVAAVCDQPRFWPSIYPAQPLPIAVASAARAAAVCRASGAPFAYAVGRAAFRHLTLDLDPRVLIPRQETEELVDAVLQVRGDAGGVAVDVGTGSGAIAIALATEGTFERVIATDIATSALEVARRNADRYRAQLRCPVEFRAGALLAPLAGEYVDVVVSNPPYIAYEEAPALPPSVRDWEPPVALFTGGAGMAATARVVRQAAGVLRPGGLLAVEVDARRAALAAELALATGYFTRVELRLDLAGRERILLGVRKDG